MFSMTERARMWTFRAKGLNGMLHVPTMTATVIPHVLRAARHAGIDPAAAVARLRLPPSITFEDRLPLARLADFWEAMLQLVKDPWFPIRAAAIPEHDELSLLAMFCRAQETLGEALRSIAQYSLLVTDAFLISARVDRDHAALAFNMPTALERLGVRCQLEFLVCDTVGGIENATGGMRPLDVAFAHPRPAAGIPPWPGGVEVRFDAPRTEIVYPWSAWNGRLRGAKPELARALRPKLDAMLTAAAGRITTSDRVRMALPELLYEGKPDGQRVARQLSVSWRTLQRRLEAAGTTFRTLLDETRFRLAREWLEHTPMPIKVVAARLGYADERAFDRAFHRWARIGPMQYRRRAARWRRAASPGTASRSSSLGFSEQTLGTAQRRSKSQDLDLEDDANRFQ